MDNIESTKSFARNKYAWPGGYPLFAITDDGGCLCHACVLENYRIIRESQNHNINDGWNVEAVDVNWEEKELYCDNCNKSIESAYGE